MCHVALNREDFLATTPSKLAAMIAGDKKPSEDFAENFTMSFSYYILDQENVPNKVRKAWKEFHLNHKNYSAMSTLLEYLMELKSAKKKTVCTRKKRVSMQRVAERGMAA